jgi:ketosteroid isomerase-like protein
MTIAAPAAVEAEIRAIQQDRIEAVQAKDAARLVSHHAPDAVAYDLLEPLQYKGAPTSGVAPSNGSMAMTGRRRRRSAISWSRRTTQGLRLVGDKWQIVREHRSLPFDMATGKVSFALKP